jgi:adenylate cyclase
MSLPQEGRDERNPQTRGDLGGRRRRLQPACRRRRGQNPRAPSRSPQRSDRPPIAAHHGRIVKRTGDGSIIEFRSVVDAVRCAIEMQNGLIERNAGVPEDRRIEFRVGIHVGDVVEESDGDLMGDGVNIAARLEGIAKPGAICLSEDAYRQVSGRLEMEVTDLGPTQLKNIDRQIRAYSLQVGVPAKPKTVRSANPSEPKRRSRLALLGAAIAALLVVLAGGAWWFLNANRPASVAAKAPAEAARLSIVVLPFANLSGDPGQDYLIDALTDELTTSLARMRDTFVIARNTAMTYKGKPIDAKAIGKDLSVRYVLEGSVQPSGDRMRVNAQLIDAGSGAHLWAEQFDTPRADLLQTQDAIVTHLARAMDLQLVQAEGARAKRTPAANPDAEDLALQCDAGTRKAGWIGKEADAAYALCDQALAIDPNNVRALMVLGTKFWLPAALGLSSDLKATSSVPTDWRRRRSPSIQITLGLTSMRGSSFSSRDAPRKPSRSTSARSRWTRPMRRPPAAWAPPTYSSGNSRKALNLSTRRFGRARTIRRSIFGMAKRRRPTTG